MSSSPKASSAKEKTHSPSYSVPHSSYPFPRRRPSDPPSRVHSPSHSHRHSQSIYRYPSSLFTFAGARKGIVGRVVLALLLWVPLLSYLNVVYWGDRMDDALVSPLLKGAKRPMWVIAHPDDESLFFSPTLNNLLRTPSRPPTKEAVQRAEGLDESIGHLLVLSVGGYEGLGRLRREEMQQSCAAFGVDKGNCVVLDHTLLPDSPDVWWPDKAVGEIVKMYVERYGIDLIITFDHDGISGHTNHRALSNAITRTVHTDPYFPPVFKLISVSLLSKYSLFLTFPSSLYSISRSRAFPLLPLYRPTPSGLYDPARSSPPTSVGLSHPAATHRSLLVNSPSQYMKARMAFAQHRSQSRWFRSLWCLTSRYMWWNVLERVVPVEDRIVHVLMEEEKDKESSPPADWTPKK